MPPLVSSFHKGGSHSHQTCWSPGVYAVAVPGSDAATSHSGAGWCLPAPSLDYTTPLEAVAISEENFMSYRMLPALCF